MAGRLLYLMGPSGSGKDTILQGVKERLDATTYIAPRTITRPCTPTERGMVSVTPAQFETMQTQGCFAMAWQANGLSYGITCDIRQWLTDGYDVMVNGSRAYLPDACRRFPELIPILLHVDQQTLETRLLHRNRETRPDVHRRLARNTRFLDLDVQHADNPIIIIDNSGPVELAIDTICQVLVRSGNRTGTLLSLQNHA